MKQRLLVAAALLIISTVGFFVFKNSQTMVPSVNQAATSTEVVHCGNDAKLCPDGSTVLREGAQCEFAACVSAYGEEKNWRTAKDPNSDISFRYPETLGNNYVTGNQWPPTFTVSKEQFSCNATSTTTNKSTVHQETINSKNYCFQEEVGAAAGSRYTTYQVTFAKESRTVTMNFVIQTVQCLNYDSSEQSACQAAQASFKVLELTDAIANSVQL